MFHRGGAKKEGGSVINLNSAVELISYDSLLEWQAQLIKVCRIDRKPSASDLGYLVQGFKVPSQTD